MKIFDCTTFFNEEMMMDVRFNILDKYVDKFIVVESRYSHSGEKKKLNFNIENYPKHKKKIRYVVIEDEPEGLFNYQDIKQNSNLKRLNSIKRIEQSYNFMSNAINDAGDEDLIMISDNDEIPNLTSLNLNDMKTNYLIFEQLFFYYKFNLLYDKMKWYGTKACKKKNLKTFSILKNLKNKEYPFWRFDTFFSKIKQIDLKIIKNGGWHFTNVKTPEELFIKFSNFGHHDEFETSNISKKDLQEKILKKEVFYDHSSDKNLSTRWNNNYKLKKIDETLLPSFLINNKDKFKKWFD